MNSILAPLRHIHRELYLFGWDIIPAVLTRLRMECLVAIACLCFCAVMLEAFQRRWLAAVTWAGSGTLLGFGMRADAMLWGTGKGAILGGAAIAMSSLGVAIALLYQLKQALREARRERRRYRRIPGTAGGMQQLEANSRRPRAAPRY